MSTAQRVPIRNQTKDLWIPCFNASIKLTAEFYKENSAVSSR